ncbi:MAG: Hpt domain-containing protein, partial [Chthoniobacteraceae bacterium]
PVKPDDIEAALTRFSEQKASHEVENRTRISSATTAPDTSGARVKLEIPSVIQDVIDLRSLAEFREIDPSATDILPQLIQVFLENTPKVFAEAHEALKINSTTQLARAAHTLKGSCSNFGARRMIEACQRLETSAAAGSMENARSMLEAVEISYSQVRTALEQELLQCPA